MYEQEHSIAKNMTWNTVGNIVYCFCQWVLTVLVVRLGSYEEAGYLSLAMTTSSSFATIALFSMRNFQVSDVQGEFDHSVYVGSRIITCAAAALSCAIYAYFSTDVYQMLCIDTFMLIRIAEGFVDVVHGIDQFRDRYDLIGKSYFLRGIATVAAFVAGYLICGELLWTLLITGIVNLVLVFAFDCVMTGRLESLRPVILDSRIVRLLGKCAPLVAASFLLSAVPMLLRTDIQSMLGNKVLGVYASISNPTLVVQVFALYVFTPLIPKMSLFYAEEKYSEFLKFFHRVLLVFCVFIVLVLAGAEVLGRPGLRILYGKEILSSYSFFMPLVWCTILTGAVWVLNAVATMIRKIFGLLGAMIAGFCACLIIKTSLISRFGANGASFAQILSYGITVACLILIIEVTLQKRVRGAKLKNAAEDSAGEWYEQEDRTQHHHRQL